MTMAPSVSYSITARLEVASHGRAVSEITRAVEQAGGVVTALDVNSGNRGTLRVDVTCAATDTAHAESLVAAMAAIPGVTVHKVSDRTFLLHLGGKIEMRSKVPLRNRDDLSMAYTPGVARVSLALAANPGDARRLTIKRNSVAVVTGLDVSGAGRDRMRVDATIAAISAEHAQAITDALATIEGVEVGKVSDRTFLMHLGGKIEMRSKIALRNRDELSMAYTPGVARVSLALAENPQDARRLTIKRNTVAVVTDGSAVLGLGNIGPIAALPVMEGKAALFKQFAGVDAWPLCLDTQDTEEIIKVVKAIAPGFAGINLEDISAPRCFEIERRLDRKSVV